MKKLLYSALLVVSGMFAVTPLVASAAEIIQPDGSTGTVVLGGTETHRNVYAAGSTTTINSSTQGDLVVAGGTVTVDGPVENDVIAIGGTIVLNSTVGGDVRVMGGTVTSNAQVTGDVIVAGGALAFSDSGKIGGDLVLVGGTVNIDSPITGGVTATGGYTNMNSSVGGPVEISRAREVTFGPLANIPGKLTVRGPNQPNVESGAQVPNLEYTQASPLELPTFFGFDFDKLVTYATIVWVLAYFVTALVLAWLAPKRISAMATATRQKFWTNAGMGFLWFIVVPIVVSILFLILVGYQLALLLLVGYIFTLMLAWALSILWLGSWIYSWFKKTPNMVINWKIALLGAAAFVVVLFIPFIGMLFCAIIMLAVLGGLLRHYRHRAMEERAAP